jgi:hypothetical protein
MVLRAWIAYHLLNILKLLLGLIELAQRQQVIPQVQAGVALAFGNGEVSLLSACSTPLPEDGSGVRRKASP